MMDNDDVRQAHEELFDQLVLGIGLLSLVVGLAVWLIEGFTSPWLLRILVVLIVLLVAFLLRRAGQFVVAAYVLVLELIGLVAGIYLQVGSLASLTLYLFIPIAVMASLLFGPQVSMGMALFTLVLVLILTATTGQFTSGHLRELWPPLGLLILTSLLSSLGSHYLIKLSRRLFDSKTFLRERTLEFLKAQADNEILQSNLAELKRQILVAKAETSRVRQETGQKDHRLFSLIGGTVQDFSTSIKQLEQVIERIAEQPASSPQTTLLPDAWHKIDHLTGLAINLHEIIELESEAVQLQYQPVEVARLVSELVSAGRGLVHEKNLELRYNISEDLPLLPADPTRLRQALLHLLTCSIGWTEQGVIEVQTELNPQELVIYISDTGRGMLTEEMSLIFQDSGQDNDAVRLSKFISNATRLGVLISKHLIGLHGGRLWGTSVPGIGSTFYVALPLKSNADKVKISPTPAVLMTDLPANHQGQMAVATAPVPKIQVAAPKLAEVKKSVTPTAQPAAVPTKLGPVARYSPVYITRFGFILLGVFFTVTVLVSVLAIANGPNRNRPIIASTIQAPAALDTPATSPLLQPSETPFPTFTPVPSATSRPVTLTPLPTATKSVPTEAAPEVLSTHQSAEAIVTPTFSPKVLPTLLPTEIIIIPPAAVSTLPATATPAEVIIAPPPATPTLSAVTVSTEVVIVPPVTPTAPPIPIHLVITPPPALPGVTAPVVTASVLLPAVSPNPPDLSFVTAQAGAPAIELLSFDSQTGVSLIAVVGPLANDLGGPPAIREGQALFTRDVNGQRNLFLARSEGQPPFSLTTGAGDNIEPAWSPNTPDRRIAFSSGRSGNFDIYVMDAEGQNLKQLTTSRGFDEWPAWSPDGRRIAFVSDRDGNVEIYTMDADGQNQQRRTNQPADDWPVVWSPDGRRLLFASQRDGNWNLYLLELDRDKLTRLTSDPGDERDPAWLPTGGQTIAFAANSGGNWDIYTLSLPADSSAEVPRSHWSQITATPTDERYPAWLP